jgi:K+-sensing histidine kinase KdpD
MMVAISGGGPCVKMLIEKTAQLAAQLDAEWYVVHVCEPRALFDRLLKRKPGAPNAELEFARSLGASSVIQGEGDVAMSLIGAARLFCIDYLVTGRSIGSRVGVRWRVPLTEKILRRLPNTVLMLV